MLSFIKSLDWKLNGAIFVLMAASFVSLASTAPELFQKQMFWYLLGITVASGIIYFDWRPLINYRGVILGVYVSIVLMLVLTLLIGTEIRGVKGWMSIANFQFQPAELAKVALIILFADFFRKKHSIIALARYPILSFLYFAVPGALVALQPDLGSVLVLFAIWFGFLMVSGISWRHLLVACIIFWFVGVGMWVAVLEDYQKERILGLFSPERDPLGIHYSVIQSIIAIGSAGFFGKGFGQGTQSQLGFLPEAQTDFIFAALVEEWGLLLGLLLIAVFAYLVLRIIRIGVASENNFNKFVCLGAAILFTVQFVVNVGSNIGLMPVIGITLPFVSYGGSSLLTNFMLIGIIHSIVLRRSFA